VCGIRLVLGSQRFPMSAKLSPYMYITSSPLCEYLAASRIQKFLLAASFCTAQCLL